MRSRIADVAATIGILILIVVGLAVGVDACNESNRIAQAVTDQREADTKFLNETITTIKNQKGEQVNITRKHLLDFIILKTIQEQRQALEQSGR